MSNYPFAAIVGADEMALALVLTTVSPEVGGVLVRGEEMLHGLRDGEFPRPQQGPRSR